MCKKYHLEMNADGDTVRFGGGRHPWRTKSFENAKSQADALVATNKYYSVWVFDCCGRAVYRVDIDGDKRI